MSELKLEFVGKQVKDMYGTFMGKVVGIITDIDGSIEAVSVDTGSSGLKQLAYEQLLVQGDYVVFIPRWRLDAQKLLRQKNLTLKRIRALHDILAENDTMKDDAELVYIKYEKRLHDLEEAEKTVNEKLQQRIDELEAERKGINAVLFDAKLQYRSNEMTEETYQQINMHTNDLLEHINLEKSEISNVRTRMSQQTLDNINSVSSSVPNLASQSTTATTNNADNNNSETTQQNVTTQGQTENMSQAQVVNASGEERPSSASNETESNWLNQVISK